MSKSYFNSTDPLLFEQELSEEDLLIMHSVREYAQSKLEPRVIEANDKGFFDRNIAVEMGSLGLLGSFLSAKYGCSEASYTAYGLAAREIERVDSGYRSFMSVQTSLVMFPISIFGSEDQKKKYLPKLATGEFIGCFGLTEPNHGSDPGSMEMRADRVKDGWVISGAKSWITNSPICDIAIVWAKIYEGSSHDGEIRGFIIEKGCSGFYTPETKYKMSVRASCTGEIVMDQVKIPNSAMLPQAKSLSAPFQCLNSARYGIGWGTIGVAEFCYQRSLQYVLERKQFSFPLGANQLIQTKLANMCTDITTMLGLAFQLGKLKDRGKEHPTMVSLVKRYNSKKALEIARMSRDIHGGNGNSGEFRVIYHMMNMETVYTYEGTYDIHGLIIGRELTGIQSFQPRGNNPYK